MGVLFKNSDITIYNKYYNSALDLNEYQRTVIRGVNWQGKKTGTVSDKGLMLADSVIIFIDRLDNYISPKQFYRIDLEKRKNYFTFAPGDRIVKGEIIFEITGFAPYRLADLEKEFDNVISVKSINELPEHFEIEGV